MFTKIMGYYHCKRRATLLRISWCEILLHIQHLNTDYFFVVCTESIRSVPVDIGKTTFFSFDTLSTLTEL